MSDKANVKNDQNEDNNGKKGGGSLGNNACCNCKEGCILGENVYCSLDGRFHPLDDKLTCNRFIPKG